MWGLPVFGLGRAYNTRLLAPGAPLLRRPVAQPARERGCRARSSRALRAGSAAVKRYAHTHRQCWGCLVAWRGRHRRSRLTGWLVSRFGSCASASIVGGRRRRVSRFSSRRLHPSSRWALMRLGLQLGCRGISGLLTTVKARPRVRLVRGRRMAGGERRLVTGFGFLCRTPAADAGHRRISGFVAQVEGPRASFSG